MKAFFTGLVVFLIIQFEFAGLLHFQLQIIEETNKLIQTYDQQLDDYIMEASASVVLVQKLDRHCSGTGFFIKAPSGKIFTLTNKHICTMGETVFITVQGITSIQRVISSSATTDLCIMSAPEKAVPLSFAKGLRNNETIFILGWPLGETLSLLKGRFAGNLFVPFSPTEVYAAGVATLGSLPGNSGSPVMNTKREVVGIIFAGRSDGPGRGYFLPLTEIISFLSDK